MRIFSCSGIAQTLVLSIALFTLCNCAEAQQPNVPKIGWLGTRPEGAGGRDILRRRLHDLGYVDGKNITFESRFANNDVGLLPALADELVRLKVAVLFTPGINEALAAKKATTTIPIIFSTTTDPVATGLVKSLSRPGSNITGLTYIGTMLSGKRLELLKEAVPRLSRVALLWNRNDPGSTEQWEKSQLAAPGLGLQLHSMEVSDANKYDRAFKDAIQARSTAVAITQSALNNSYQKRMAGLAIKNHLPTIYPRVDFTENGGLMSYGADQTDLYRRAASLVDKILKGAKPADIPVEQPTKFEFVVNLKTAKQIGLTIPPNVLARADRVIR